VNTCRQPAATTLREGTISHRFNNFVTLAVIVMMVFVLGASSALAENAIPFINTPLVPGFKAPGSAAFTLTVDGTGFVSGAVVNWNGSARVTTFVSSSKLTAAILAADVATAETVSVTVSNPGGIVSNVAHFEVVKAFTSAFGKLDYSTDLTPADVATADFNGDGIADLAVATGNNTVSILLGVGNGTFPTHVEYPVPGHPSAIVVGDFNGDGKIDVATVDPYQSEISILLGNGDGTFQAHKEYLTGNQPVELATADVNGDGKLDIIVADYHDETVAVLLGNGDGTFQAHVDYPTGNGPSSVAIGDFNGDGKLDLAIANNTDNTVAILEGNGDGTFQGATPFPTAVGANSVVVGDFNGDGKLDLAVGTSNKQVSVLLGNGDGTFQNHKEYSIGANAVIVATADINSDGKLDLVSANFNDNTVSVLIGNGDGTFKSESIYPTNAGPSGLAIADFNGNGKLDIAAVANTANKVSVLTDNFISLTPSVLAYGKQTSGDKSSAKTITLKNNGTTTYTLGTIAQIGAFPTDFTYTTTCGTTVLAGKTCTFSIVFDPTASEAANAQLTITASNGSVIGAQMSGTGNIPIYLAPRTMTFTYQLLGTTSAGKTDTFTNDSGVDIYFTNIDLEGANPTEFSFTTTCAGGDGNYSIPLLPGASCSSTIKYTPNAVGGANITQVYYGNFTLAKQGLLISGEGTAVQVTPTTLTFAAQTAGTTSPAKIVTFKNAGSVPLPLSSIAWSGQNDFAQTNTCGTPAVVPANSSCTFSITFTPSAVGSFSATLSIGDTDPTGPQKITVTGTGD
jgi:hypothetical protein